MNKNKVLLLKNCSTGLVSQVMTLIFQFLTRSLFIRYIGIELLGVYSTFTSVLSTLSLAELGFQTAIVFSLYKPLAQRDEQQINDIVNVFRFVYDCIGAFFYSGFLGPSAVLKVYPHRDNRDECDLSLFSDPGVFLSVHLFFGL